MGGPEGVRNRQAEILRATHYIIVNGVAKAFTSYDDALKSRDENTVADVGDFISTEDEDKLVILTRDEYLEWYAEQQRSKSKPTQ